MKPNTIKTILGLILILIGAGLGAGLTNNSRQVAIKAERAKTTRLETEFQRSTTELKAEHAGKIHWLQSRQDNELTRLSGETEAIAQREFREGLFLACMWAMMYPSRGLPAPYDRAIDSCNNYAATIWQSDLYDRGPPPGIDHNEIKGIDTTLESG